MKIIAENEDKPIAEVKKFQLARTLKKIEKQQSPYIEAINLHLEKLATELKSDFEQLKNEQNRVHSETNAVIMQSGEILNVKPSLDPKTIWREQIKAAQRNDSEIFNQLKEIHLRNGIRRPNNVYARLRGIELLAELNSREEDNKLLATHYSGRSRKHIVVKLKLEDEVLKIENLCLEITRAEHQQFPADHETVKKQFANDRQTGNRETQKQVRHPVAPFLPVAEKLAWFTKPMQTLNAHYNPIEIVRNDPGVQIVRAVKNYLDHHSRAEDLKEIAEEYFEQVEAVKVQFATESVKKTQATADAVRNAIRDEEALRADLKKNNAMSETELLETPARALSDAEMQRIYHAAAKLGDGDLLEKTHNVINEDSSLAKAIGETNERIAAKSLLAQMRAAEASSRAIENIRVSKVTGTMEVEINPVRFIEAGNQIVVGDVAERWRASHGEKDALPHFNLEETETAERMLKSFNVRTDLSEFIESQYVRAADGIAKALEQPLSVAEQVMFKEMTLSQEVLERFEQIAQSEFTLDEISRQGEIATLNNVPFQNVGHNYIVTNPSDERENEAKQFWEQERIAREREIARDKLDARRTQTAEEAAIKKALEMDAIRAAKKAEELEETTFTLKM